MIYLSIATSRPWFIQQPGDGHPYIIATTGDRYGKNIVYGEPTGGGAYFIGHEDVCEANAELIVRAVNSHEKLIEALEGFIQLIDKGVLIESYKQALGYERVQAKADFASALLNASTALAAARGESGVGA